MPHNKEQEFTTSLSDYFVLDPHVDRSHRTCPPLSVFDELQVRARSAGWQDEAAATYRAQRREAISELQEQVSSITDEARAGLATLECHIAGVLRWIRASHSLREMCEALEAGRVEQLPPPIRSALDTLMKGTDRPPDTVSQVVYENLRVAFGAADPLAAVPTTAELAGDITAFIEGINAGSSAVSWRAEVNAIVTQLQAFARLLVDEAEPVTRWGALILEEGTPILSELKALLAERSLGTPSTDRLLSLARKNVEALEELELSNEVRPAGGHVYYYIVALARALFEPHLRPEGADEQEDLSRFRRIVLGAIRGAGSIDRFMGRLGGTCNEIGADELSPSCALRLAIELRACADEVRNAEAVLRPLGLPATCEFELAGTLGFEESKQLVSLATNSGVSLAAVGSILAYDPRVAVAAQENPIRLDPVRFQDLLSFLKDYYREAQELVSVVGLSPIHSPDRFVDPAARELLMRELQLLHADPNVAALRAPRKLMTELAGEFLERGLGKTEAAVAACVLVFGFTTEDSGGRKLLPPFTSITTEQVRGNLPATDLNGALNRESVAAAIKWLVERGSVLSHGGGRYRLTRPLKVSGEHAERLPHIRVMRLYMQPGPSPHPEEQG